jgi:hypothetical protein
MKKQKQKRRREEREKKKGKERNRGRRCKDRPDMTTVHTRIQYVHTRSIVADSIHPFHFSHYDPTQFLRALRDQHPEFGALTTPESTVNTATVTNS